MTYKPATAVGWVADDDRAWSMDRVVAGKRETCFGCIAAAVGGDSMFMPNRCYS